ncbi:MAG: DUF2586 family protein [Desulfobacterales bacterium]|nr:DUF2586 family protein [Desulfobacterales bacterium]
MGNVTEYIVDGTSGLSPDTGGSCIAAGVCSLGTVGKGYLLGKSSDIRGMLGVGPLTRAVEDFFSCAGQNATIIAVPVAGMPGGYITPLTHSGSGPDASISGVAAENAEIVAEIVLSGALGTATAKISVDGGLNFGDAEVIPVSGQVPCGSSGSTLVFSGEQITGDTYSFLTRVPIGPITKIGTGPDIKVEGTIKAAADVVIRITEGGERNVATYQISTDGEDNWSVLKTVPVDGIITVDDTGATITIPTDATVTGDTYKFTLNAPVASISSVMTALETPLELYDVEFVHVACPSDATDWAAMGAKADELWNDHSPTFFLAEVRNPFDNEDINDWTAFLMAEKSKYSHRFVSACAVFGEISTTKDRLVRNWGGLASGRIMSLPVMRAMGRVASGGITAGTLPDAYNSAVQTTLEKKGFLTARKLKGLSSAHWGDAKTLADITSDYQYIEVLRVAFKAIRLARPAALNSLNDEAGDPKSGEATGLVTLKTNVENAILTMNKAIPMELAGVVVTIPEGQDIVNNGVAVEIELIGIPIMRNIKLFQNYVYAGSVQDPR